jgi:hypothetical protein
MYNTVFSEHYINSERGDNSKFTCFLHIFQLRSFQIIILQTFLIAIIINNNIGKYLLIRKKIKKERNCEFLVKGTCKVGKFYSYLGQR